MQAACVQTDEYARISSSTGRTSTTRSASNTRPPPTGISATVASGSSTVGEPGPADGDRLEPETLSALPVPSVQPDRPNPVTRPARAARRAGPIRVPARPAAPASTVRRLGAERGGSGSADESERADGSVDADMVWIREPADSRSRPAQARKISFPLTEMFSLGSGVGAGPATTEASAIAYWLPWHGHMMTPSATVDTTHPWWVQTALKHLKSPESGWVTTTRLSGKIFPPPTGMSDVLASASPPPLAGGELVAPGGVDPPVAGGEVVPLDDAPLPPESPHPANVEAANTAPAPATPRST